MYLKHVIKGRMYPSELMVACVLEAVIMPKAQRALG